MLDVNENRFSAAFLRFGDDVKRHRSLTGRLRSEDFNNSSLGNAADSQCMIKQQRAGGNRFDIQRAVLTELHHGALSELAFDLEQCGLQCLLFFVSHPVNPPSVWLQRYKIRKFCKKMHAVLVS